MKPRSTMFLRGAIYVIGMVVLVLCIFVLPVGLQTDKTGEYWPIILGMYLTAVPFFTALYHALALLHNIDIRNAFSIQSVDTLKSIKYCAGIISLVYGFGMPYIFYVGDKDDAPGIILAGFIVTFASFIIAMFAGLLQKLLQSAVEIKSENDLTV